MKKFFALSLAALVALTLMLPVSLAVPADEGPVQMIIHYKNEYIDWNEAGVGSPINIVNTIVLKEMDFGLPPLKELGWSSFDPGFTAEDDFGKIFTFTAGYLETDVSEIHITQSWADITVMNIPLNMVDENDKIEVWVTADGPGSFLLEEGAEPGLTTCQIAYEAPEGFSPYDPEAAAEEEPVAAEEEPIVEEEPVLEEPSPVEEPSPDPLPVEEPPPEPVSSPAEPSPTPEAESGANVWLWAGIVVGVLVVLFVVVVFAMKKKK
ncbi:MAG: hypothetical protein LBR72_01840 [Oscillospiraceae bacterium]|jgi:hypothetical protein|nr:hypothetical protein [Oscillospiraceae bacterium]